MRSILSLTWPSMQDASFSWGQRHKRRFGFRDVYSLHHVYVVNPLSKESGIWVVL